MTRSKEFMVYLKMHKMLRIFGKEKDKKHPYCKHFYFEI